MLPFFFTALKVSTTLAFIGAIVGEFYGGTSDVLGRVVLTQISGGSFDVAWAAILLGAWGDRLVPWRVIVAAERLVIPWYAPRGAAEERCDVAIRDQAGTACARQWRFTRRLVRYVCARRDATSRRRCARWLVGGGWFNDERAATFRLIAAGRLVDGWSARMRWPGPPRPRRQPRVAPAPVGAAGAVRRLLRGRPRGLLRGAGPEGEPAAGGPTVDNQTVGSDPNGPEFTIAWVPKVLVLRTRASRTWSTSPRSSSARAPARSRGRPPASPRRPTGRARRSASGTSATTTRSSPRPASRLRRSTTRPTTRG